MSVLIIFVIIIATCIAAWYFKTKRLIDLVNKYPGPKGWPILGNALDLPTDPADFVSLMSSYFQKWPRYFRIWLGPQPIVYLCNAKDTEVILSSSSHINKASLYNFLYPWLGTGLLTSSGRKWQTRRKLLTPSFHFRILDDFVPIFNEQSDTLIEILNQNVKKSSFDIFPLIILCTLDIICESVMGVKVNAQINSESPYVKALDRIKEILHLRMYKYYVYPEILFNLLPEARDHTKCLKILHNFSEKVIRERKETWQQNQNSDLETKKKRLAFLDLLLEASDNGKNLSDSDIREEVDTFMFEGHDTTSVGISWTLFLLGHNQQIQKKVHEELDSIFGNDKQKHASMDDLKHMKYLDCVIKESQRIFPSVPFIGRAIRNDVVVDGKIIPAGTNVGIAPFFLHRDPNVFPDPENFDPDRFSPENSLNRNPFAYIPFSAGPRNCIGQKFAMLELKVILSRVLRSFNVQSIVPQKDIKYTAELMTMPHNGILLHISPRT